MSELTQNKQVTILLAVVAALLAAIIGLLVWQNTRIPEPDPNAVSSQQPTSADPAASSAVPAAGADFDPETAPVVPADQTPEQYVTAYYETCQSGDYDSAFVMLPTATQAYYGDSTGFATTLQGYGVTGFAVQPQTEVDADTITVVGAQDAQGMSFPYTWTFVKSDDGSWLCAGREMGAQ